MSSEKTEKPTPQRRREARRDGRGVARTPDLGAWTGILAVTLLLPLVLRVTGARCLALLGELPEVIAHPEPALVLAAVRQAGVAIALGLSALCLPLMLIAVLAAAGQGGVHPAPKLLMPRFSRLNPINGLRNSLGPHAWWEGAKALLKTAILAAVLYLVTRRLMAQLMGSGILPLSTIVSIVIDAVLSLARAAALAGLLLAAADYAVVRRRVDRQLKMTKEEVRDEHKRTEGDPQVRSAIRARQLAMSRNRMMAELPRADVVVVNPTHVAVALRYEPAKGAPRVVAKGADKIAARIREVAMEHRIPLIQDAPLARALHASCEIGAEIPPELYTAVARVLAFVIGLKSRGSAAGLHRPPQPATA